MQKAECLETAKLTELLRGSKKMLLFTGAGISTGSGIPDFRGPEGVWKRRQPVYYHDFMRSEAARVEHWDYKLEGWPAFREARPNATHEAIARLEQAGKVRAVVTQNIDGLHARAGTPAVERVRDLVPGGRRHVAVVEAGRDERHARARACERGAERAVVRRRVRRRVHDVDAQGRGGARGRGGGHRPPR